MRLQKVDHGQSFDFGKTSKDYSKFRDIYPPELYDRLYALGVGARGSRWLDLGTGTGELPRGLARHGADILAVDASREQIEQAMSLSRDIPNIRYQVCRAEDVALPDHSLDVITACQCFWYFDPLVVVSKIKAMLREGGLFLKVYMSYLKEDPVASRSSEMVKEFNPSWNGGSPAVQDLITHYFDHPHMENFMADLPFTRESWHGRMKTCRGVLASMDEETFSRFEQRHLKFLSGLPEQFTVRHKVFLTFYYIG